MKFKRIAVILIGHFRTFPYLNNHYHKFFHSMAEKVDYFVITWDRVDFYSAKRVKWTPNYFGSWLKKLIVLSDSDVDINPLDRTLKLAYLAKLGTAEKIKVEKEEGFTYDYVIETRPDLYFSSKWDFNYSDLTDNQIIMQGGMIFNTGDITETNQPRKWNTDLDDISTFSSGDWYWRMNSITYDNFSNRYDFLNSINRDITTDFHMQLAPYFVNHPQFKIQIAGDWNDFWPCWPADLIKNIPEL